VRARAFRGGAFNSDATRRRRAQPDDEAFAANEALVEKLLELDDVDAVVTNQNDDDGKD